ncbi:unnamed protein product [Sphagnum troendelagicum]
MKKTVIKIGGGCLFNDVISRRPPGNKLSLAFYWLDHATSLVAGASTKSFRLSIQAVTQLWSESCSTCQTSRDFLF